MEVLSIVKTLIEDIIRNEAPKYKTYMECVQRPSKAIAFKVHNNTCIKSGGYFI
jgi:hypothetical protein